MTTGTISDASLKYFEDKHIKSLLDEAMKEVFMQMPEDPLLFLQEAFQRKTPMRLMVAGPPGSGKGTQCRRLAERYRLRHISAGDILRDAASSAAGGETATKIAKHIQEGSLVPDELFVDLMVHEVRDAEAEGRGWILDGFPRTRAQAIYLQTSGISPQRFFHLDVPSTVGAARSLDRRNADGTTAHNVDDNPTSVKTRLDYFDARKEELLDCYRPFYVHIDGSRSTEQVFDEVCTQCDALGLAE